MEEANLLSFDILKAPDEFMAAVIMKESNIAYGSGQVQAVIDTLCEKDPKEIDFKRIADKLYLLKHGYIFKKGVKPGKFVPDHEKIKLIDDAHTSTSEKN